jgi:hypothetical protein
MGKEGVSFITKTQMLFRDHSYRNHTAAGSGSWVRLQKTGGRLLEKNLDSDIGFFCSFPHSFITALNFSLSKLFLNINFGG